MQTLAWHFSTSKATIHGSRPPLFLGGITRSGEKKRPIAVLDNEPLKYILTQCFYLYYPEQIPENFKISQLWSEISAWVLSILRTAASCLIAEQKKATSHMTGHGDAGSDFVPKLDKAMTLSLLTYSQSDKNSSAFGPRNGRREAKKSKESVRN